MTRRDAVSFALLAPAFNRFAEAMADEGETGIPFLDSQPFNPEKPRLKLDELKDWVSPVEQRFRVGHYGFPDVDEKSWKLEIAGLVNRPLALSLEDLKKRKVREQITTIECSGNPANGGMVYNAKWTGTPLHLLLKDAGVKPEAFETVFFAADTGTEKIRGGEYVQNFVRSLSMKDATRDDVLLCWAMDGQPLGKNFGGPIRIVAPGWYGVAWVKWLTRIELHDRPYLGRFTGRDYVTIRGEKQGDKTIWRETSVGKMNLKSVAGRAAKQKDGTIRITGAAWSDGTPIQKVEVKVDDGQWVAADLHKENKIPNTWTFWHWDWKDAKPGEHTVTSRAIDSKGRVQPAPDDPFITLKRTYWEANQQAVRKIKI